MENSSQNKVAKRLPWEKPGFKTFEIDKNIQVQGTSDLSGSSGCMPESYMSTSRNVNTDVESSSGSMFESNSFNDNPFTTE